MFLAVAAVIAVVAVIMLGGAGADQEQAAAPAATTGTVAPPVATVPERTVSPGPATTATATTTDAAPEPQVPPPPRIEIEGGEPAGGIEELRFEQGERVRFSVVSDVADHVHVHGYDVFKDLTPGKEVVFSFPADITGIFEVELEERGVEIAQLRVDPR